MSSFPFARSVYANIDFTRLRNLLPTPFKSFAVNPSVDFRREDETDDAYFYLMPRFVHHIDDRARYVIGQFYAYTLKSTAETKILDICSSWTSHLPENVIGKSFQHCSENQTTRYSFSLGQIHGLGMNESELKANPSLTAGYTVQDLNKNPSLQQIPFNTFDAVLCTVSVDYLTRPLEVFNEIGRILKPNGQFITSFSNRCFPTKVIGKWLKINEEQRVQWIANYFLLTNTFFDPQTVKAYSLFDDQLLPSRDGEFRDPMYIVFGRKKTNLE